GVYAGGVFSLHMFVHMVLNMVAPVLLVLGGPVTLALRALPARGRGAAAGPREWLLAVLHSPLTRVLAGPGVATVLFVGSFYALYFTDLFELGMFEYWGHQLMKAHFLLVGYLYYWTVIGVDPAPRPLPHLARLGVVLAVMPFHAFFGIITMSLSSPLAEDFYRALELPWPRDLLADQFLGGGIAWAMGEVPLVLVLGALLTQWYRHDTRLARRVDRSDDELAAYNAMLAELARKRGG
ncbi:cytochrome c oxidase assembly protein, partial [Actinopolyspora mortivallis]